MVDSVVVEVEEEEDEEAVIAAVQANSHWQQTQTINVTFFSLFIIIYFIHWNITILIDLLVEENNDMRFEFCVLFRDVR